MGKPHHVLCSQRVCCGHRIEHTHAEIYMLIYISINILKWSPLPSEEECSVSLWTAGGHQVPESTSIQLFERLKAWPLTAGFSSAFRCTSSSWCIYLLMSLQCFNSFTLTSMYHWRLTDGAVSNTSSVFVPCLFCVSCQREKKDFCTQISSLQENKQEISEQHTLTFELFVFFNDLSFIKLSCSVLIVL